MKLIGSIKKIVSTVGDEKVVGHITIEFNASEHHGAIQELAEMQEVSTVDIEIRTLQAKFGFKDKEHK